MTSGCSGPQKIDDPIGSLRDPSLSPRYQEGAMAALDPTPQDETYLKALHRVIWLPGYTVQVREAAFERLKINDLDGLKVTIRRYLPRLSTPLWRSRLCTIIADEGWIELTPALVSSLARYLGEQINENQRPEFVALERLHGEGRVPDVVFDLFIESSRVSQQGLRTRCWELIHRFGQRQRLIDLIASGEFSTDDLFLQDLHTGLVELDVMPKNREEILWLRELCKSQYAEFRSQAAQAISSTDVLGHKELEIRDLPILVSALLHEPELLAIDRDALYRELLEALKGRKHYTTESNYDQFATNSRQSLYEYHDLLTWGDLAAMRIANRALTVPQVVEHLFDYAARDRADTGTEYGGVLNLDAKGRFEVLEFPPRMRNHDRQFNAPQAMFDSAYTSLFHFHYHAQKHLNSRYAGPGYGDVNYAQNTGANCLVFTYINETTLNVDYYRHGRVIVDLGVITRE